MVESRGKRVVELKQVLREVRIATAERNDIIAATREADQARLELLGDALEGVFDGLPRDNDQLLLGLLPGQPPRFWVDATSFVMMGRDKRQYKFVKDTRAGRAVLAESASVETIADAITRYVAERIVEREQAIEGDWLKSPAGNPRPAAVTARGDSAALIWGLCGFGLGMISGMFLLLAYAWFALA